MAFAAVTNKESSHWNNQKKLSPKYTKKMAKLGLEVLTGKALSFLLEFIDETGEEVFCLQ